MWTWILLGGAALCGGLASLLRKRVAVVREPVAQRQWFVCALAEEIRCAGEDYDVRGVVLGSFTMIVSVCGQEIPVPLENLYLHHLAFPDQLSNLVGQLLTEIEEVGLERPTDHNFVEAAMRILPQVCPTAWVFDNAPAFGDSAIVHRELGPTLSICYVIDNPWSMVFVCNAHLHMWRRAEEDLFHLANQNLRRLSGADLPMPEDVGGPVRVRSGDGYDAARVLLLDPSRAEDLLIALPERNTLYLGREEDRENISSLMAQDVAPGGHPVSPELYRFEDQRLVPVSAPDPG